ncbi:selenide, water dikinase SelD [bacterium]|nr:selenide, water dikinase SelD [bacterium]
MSPLDLRTVLAGLPKFTDDNLLVGMETSDDAGVYCLNDDTALIQTVDFFTPIVDDPYTFGQISASNALSDIYAMGGKPLTALNIVCFPTKELPIEVLQKIMEGGAERIKAAGAVLVGGHSIEDKEIKYGLSVTGIISPHDIITNANAKPGDVLVLTKPIGTGVTATAIKKGDASPSDVKEIVQSMIQLNDRGAEVMRQFKTSAATDISGFGLLGHAFEMATASGVNLTIVSSQVPFFKKARKFASHKKYLTKGNRLNRLLIGDSLIQPKINDEAADNLLYDPQTSGGLLIAIQKNLADNLVTALRNYGYSSAAIIGFVTEGTGKIILD